MTYTLGILLVWVFGLLAGAAAVVCAVLLMTLRIAHGGGSSGQRKLIGATLILLALAIFISLSYATAYIRARAELDAEIALVRERGEPLWFSELEPEAIDPALDATPLFDEARAALVDISMDCNELLWEEPHPPLRDHPAYRQALAENAEALALLAEALERPHLRSSRDYQSSEPMSQSFADAGNAHDFARLLSTEVYLALTVNDCDQMIKSIEAMLALSSLLRQEPFLVDLLVGLAIGGMAVDLIELVVSHAELSIDQFKELDSMFDAIESDIKMSRSVVMERAWMITELDQLRSDKALGLISLCAELRDMAADEAFGFWPETGTLWSSLLYRPLLIRDEAFMLSSIREVVGKIDQRGAEGLEFMSDFTERIDAEISDYPAAEMFFPAFGSTLHAVLRYRQALTCARLGLRVDHYRAEHGRLPQSLGDVLGDAFSEVPRDLFNDRPLVYEITDGGFSIHMDTSDATDFEREQATYSSFDVSYDSTEAE